MRPSTARARPAKIRPVAAKKRLAREQDPVSALHALTRLLRERQADSVLAAVRRCVEALAPAFHVYDGRERRAVAKALHTAASRIELALGAKPGEGRGKRKHAPELAAARHVRAALAKAPMEQLEATAQVAVTAVATGEIVMGQEIFPSFDALDPATRERVVVETVRAVVAERRTWVKSLLAQELVEKLSTAFGNPSGRKLFDAELKAPRKPR